MFAQQSQAARQQLLYHLCAASGVIAKIYYINYKQD